MKMKSLLLVALATLGLTSSTRAQNIPNYVPANGLVGWWPFNGNANDESGNGNNGTVNGATLAADRFGNSNTAYSFDGITNNIITNFAFPTGNQPKSVSLWYTTNDVNDRAWIISNNLACNEINSQDKGFGLFMDGDSNNGGSSETPTLIFHGSGPISDMYFLNTNFTASNWYHIAVTYDGSSLKSFVNGALNNNIIISLNTIDNSVLFGSRTTQYVNGCPEEYHDGNIDDIGIWNRALTQQEITDLYNANICYQTITVTDTLLINTGIVTYNPVTYNNTIKIFPNPTNDHITIDYGNFATMNGYQLKIENSLGQELFQTIISQQTDYLSLNNWGGNGLYFVHIVDPQGNTIDIRKIVLQ